MDVSGTIRCVIVTPERAVLDEQVDFVALPMYDGELGVMRGRSPLIGRLGYGELRIDKEGEKRLYFVDSGFVQIRDNVVTVLTPRAMLASEIDTSAAEEALAGSLAMADSPEKQEANKRAQERARAQLRVALHSR